MGNALRSLPALPLPGDWLLAYSVLWLVAAALTVVVALAGIVVGQVIAWGFKLGRGYWRG